MGVKNERDTRQPRCCPRQEAHLLGEVSAFSQFRCITGVWRFFDYSFSGPVLPKTRGDGLTSRMDLKRASGQAAEPPSARVRELCTRQTGRKHKQGEPEEKQGTGEPEHPRR